MSAILCAGILHLPTSSVMSMSWPASRWRCMGFDHSPGAGGATGTSVGGSATVVAALAPPAAPRVERRLAGLSAGVAEAEGRLRLELEAAAALRVDMAGLGWRRNPALVANSALNRSGGT